MQEDIEVWRSAILLMGSWEEFVLYEACIFSRDLPAIYRVSERWRLGNDAAESTDSLSVARQTRGVFCSIIIEGSPYEERRQK